MDLDTNLGSKYIFVIGMPRSGTSLLQKILNNHSQIYGGPEFMHLIPISNLYRKMYEGLINERQRTYYDKEHLSQNIRDFVHNIFLEKINKEGVGFISEKTPDNIYALDVLVELFPKAKYIIIIRNPFGVLNSFRKVGERAKKINASVNLGMDIEKDCDKIINYHKFIEDFRKNAKVGFHTVFYEDLVNKPNGEINQITKFLGVDFEKSMTNTKKENENSKLLNLNNASAWYTKEMYDSSINKEKTEEWKSELTVFEKKLVSFKFRCQKYPLIQKYSNSFNKLNPFDFFMIQNHNRLKRIFKIIK